MSTPQQPPRLNELAILSLVSAFFLSLMAVITGHIALSQIRRSGERGREFAVAGIVIGYIGLAAGLLTTLVVIVAIMIATAFGGFTHRNVFTSPLPDARGPGSTVVPTPGADPYAPATPSDITFDAGTSLDAGTVPHISDGLLGDSQWKLSTPKADGTWVYTSADGRCTTTFHEGALDEGLDVTKGDDLATTDSYLAALTSSSAADVADFADDDYVTLDQPEDNAIVETRRLAGNDSGGRPHVAVARAFAALEQGVSINIACDTKALAIDAYDHVLSKTALLVG